LDNFAAAWRPEPGDKLIGVVADLDERASQYDEDAYPVVTVETDDGRELAFHAFHTVARNELAKQRPQIGDRIAIRYAGRPAGKSYEAYRIVVERPDAPPRTIDWDKHATPDEAEDEPAEEDDNPQDAEADDGDIPF
jgi:hypothetical protein